MIVLFLISVGFASPNEIFFCEYGKPEILRLKKFPFELRSVVETTGFPPESTTDIDS
jgi:hypothetical protein